MPGFDNPVFGSNIVRRKMPSFCAFPIRWQYKFFYWHCEMNCHFESKSMRTWLNNIVYLYKLDESHEKCMLSWVCHFPLLIKRVNRGELFFSDILCLPLLQMNACARNTCDEQIIIDKICHTSWQRNLNRILKGTPR